MVDFTKTLFGFGGFNNKSEAQQNEQDHTQSLRHHQQPEQQQQQQQQQQLDHAQPPEPQVGLLPNFPHTSTPTTALSDNSLVYGTTTKQYHPQTMLSKVAANSSGNSINNGSNTSNLSSQLSSRDEAVTKPIIKSTISDDGTPDSSIPRGKLKVNIIQAKDLLTKNSNAHPYVVCTFESSEFITHGPESVDNHPTIASNNNHHNNNNNNNNKTNNIHNNTIHNNNNSKKASNPRPLYSRQSSSQHLNRLNQRISPKNDLVSTNTSNPVWHHETIFDVVGSHSELDISVYDSDETFLGHVRIKPTILSNNEKHIEWYKLQSRVDGEHIGGEIKVSFEFSTTGKRHYGPEDFEVLRLLGKGTFGQVFQVRKLDTDRIYAMKVLSKKVIVRKKEIAHTIGERNILVRTASTASPFIVGLKFSFQTPTDLYLVTDYMSGGELFWHLQKEGRFLEDRAKFYIAELVLSLEHLHDNDIVYRDLKPENILLDANGHIALCDFGLSKADISTNDTTNTFCGTTEYLAPEVLLDESGYTKMVDFWSLGVLIFEMCCGWSPFYADNVQQMYKNIAFGKVRFPKEVLSSEGRAFVKGLLNRNPKHRLGSQDDARELRAHPFFHDIDWELLRQKKVPPPFKPHLASETDTSNFDPEFTDTSQSVINKQFHQLASTPLSPGIQANFKGFTFVDESTMEEFNSKRNNINNNLRNGEFGSFIPGNPNLPPDEDVIDEDEDDEDGKIDMDGDHEMDDEFVNGQFDL